MRVLRNYVDARRRRHSRDGIYVRCLIDTAVGSPALSKSGILLGVVAYGVLFHKLSRIHRIRCTHSQFIFDP